MTEYRLVGGPFDGTRVDSRAAVLVIPIRQPVTAAWPDDDRLTIAPRVEYFRVGDVYRWEGLVEDAWADCDVSDQLLAEVGAPIRRELRLMLRDKLEELAAGKDLGRIVWRIARSSRPFSVTFRARVGPRAVEFGLHDRSERSLPASLPAEPSDGGSA